MNWPKTYTAWTEGRILYLSIPFTWSLPLIKEELLQKSLFWDRVVVGGPAVQLIPDFFSGSPYVTVGSHMPGVLQKVNPMATRTTVGCVNKCAFCGVPKIEGVFTELPDWPDLPIICDNNLLAASVEHFDRVIDRLIVHGWVDFNQGLDARLLTEHHAGRIAEITRPMIRLALDSMAMADEWVCAFKRLRSAGIPLKSIRSYALIGFDTGPDEAWERCRFIESHGIKVLPMWFHRLDALLKNTVTARQVELGWSYYEYRRIMQWFYQHKNAVPPKLGGPLK